MVIRILAMAGGLAGAVALSQFPEFSQQYLQRLSGALDELRPIVATFDATARAQDLSRDAALEQIGGNAVADDLRRSMAASIARYERLEADYQGLAAAGPLERLARPWHFRDTDLVRRTWEEYRPAVPVTPEGLACAGLGFAGGFLAVALVLGGLRRVLFGRARLA
jgi:hypothetical protein